MDGPVYIPRRVDYIRDVFRPKQFVPEKTIDESKEVKHKSVYGGECGSGYGRMGNRFDETTSSYGKQSLSMEEKVEAERLYQRIREIEKMHPSPIEDSDVMSSPQWSGGGGEKPSGIGCQSSAHCVSHEASVDASVDGISLSAAGISFRDSALLSVSDVELSSVNNSSLSINTTANSSLSINITNDSSLSINNTNDSSLSIINTNDSPLSTNTTINSSPQHNSPTTTEVRFLVDQCACAECSPVILPDGSLFCELCHVPILQDTWVAHMRSICHQMKRCGGTHQYINPYMKPSSQAYHLMQSMGWKEGEGLGVEGQGRLEPIATRLKNNRLGIGAQDNAPLEVTHVERIDPVVEKERERLIRKFGKKRLNRLIKRYFRKKEQMESRKRDAWLHEEFRRDWECLLRMISEVSRRNGIMEVGHN